ncbi:MAG: hypothetical protein HQM15_08095 [Deltaproteobacteria bacterium]|nr:hypothetical protein [Deltaproteobacteria bacterium]
MPKISTQTHTKPLVCSFCRQEKASLKSNLHCGICQNLFCKDCLQFVEDSSFSFLNSIPEFLRHNAYCVPCYDQQVLPALQEYSKKMEQAKQVSLFFKKVTQTPVLRRSKTKVNVVNCPDRSEALMRLAFSAVELSFNALIEIDLNSEKKVVHGYQSLFWNASAYPAEIGRSKHEEKILRAEKPQPEVFRKGKKEWAGGEEGLRRLPH